MRSSAHSGTATVGTAAERRPHAILSGHHQNHPGGGSPGPCRASPGWAGRLCPGSLDTKMLSTASMGAPGAVAAPEGAPEPSLPRATAALG